MERNEPSLKRLRAWIARDKRAQAQGNAAIDPRAMDDALKVRDLLEEGAYASVAAHLLRGIYAQTKRAHTPPSALSSERMKAGAATASLVLERARGLMLHGDPEASLVLKRTEELSAAWLPGWREGEVQARAEAARWARILEAPRCPDTGADVGLEAEAILEDARSILAQTAPLLALLLSSSGSSEAKEPGRVLCMLECARGQFRFEARRQRAEAQRVLVETPLSSALSKVALEETSGRLFAPCSRVSLLKRDKAVVFHSANETAFSQIELVHAAALGAAQTRAHPALSEEFAWAPLQSVARTAAAIAVLAAGDGPLHRALRDAAQARAWERASFAWLVLSLRLAAAGTLHAAERSALRRPGLANLHVDETGDTIAPAARVEEALGAPLPPSIAAALLESTTDWPTRLRALHCGIGAWWTLREEYDEDWIANPRARPWWESGLERAGSISAERWLQETGASPNLRILEERAERI